MIMTTPKFFFDTADVDYISNVWDGLVGHVPPDSVAGVTTNPNALSKVGCMTVGEMAIIINNLCKLVTRLRCGTHGGVVYTQTPNSLMTPEEIFDWARYITELTDGVTYVGIKIPHFTYALDLAKDLADMGVEVNVTGIADWGTLLKAFTYPSVTYASIITGRMDEAGINSDEHLRFVQTIVLHPHQSVIAGSMRTIDGLKKAILRRAVPTIGTRVWNKILEEGVAHQMGEWWESNPNVVVGADYEHGPLITDASRQLSWDFFLQMDSLGQGLYKEFTK
jgi:transaldolase